MSPFGLIYAPINRTAESTISFLTDTPSLSVEWVFRMSFKRHDSQNSRNPASTVKYYRGKRVAIGSTTDLCCRVSHLQLIRISTDKTIQLRFSPRFTSPLTIRQKCRIIFPRERFHPRSHRVFTGQAALLQGHSVAELRSIADNIVGQPARICLIHGHSSIYHASLALGVASRKPFALIDGSMRFNSYTLSALAQSFSLPPRSVLQRAHITRSFTAFQTEAAIKEKLPGFLRHTPCALIIIMGLLDTYYDDQIRPQECRQSLHRIFQALRQMIQQDTRVLIADTEMTLAAAGKQQLFQLVRSAVDITITVMHTTTGFHLNKEGGIMHGAQ